MLTIKMTARPRKGRGLFEFDIYYDGEFLGGAACHPQFQRSVPDQLDDILQGLLEYHEIHLTEFETYEAMTNIVFAS